MSGNLVRAQVRSIIDKPFEVSKNKPVIYITGGSLGAHSINVLIEKIIVPLLEQYTIIHQAGNIEKYKDYERLTKAKEKLSQSLKKNYHIRTHIPSTEIGYIYSVTDLVVSRAGANTYAELLLLRKPTLFIPLPESAYYEQHKHAAIFQENKIGEVFDQSQSSEKLLALIDKMIDNIGDYQHNFEKLSIINNNASSIIFQAISQKT